MIWAWDKYWVAFGGNAPVPDYRGMGTDDRNRAETALLTAIQRKTRLTLDEVRALERRA
jgi:hypothetical protein